MAKTRLTDSYVKGLKPQARKYYVRDTLPGLTVCVYPTGVKSWVYIYTIDAKPYHYTLGNYPDISLAEARSRYDEARKQRAKGVNPSLDAKKRRNKRLTDPTVSEYIEDYLESLTKKSKEQDIWALNKYVVPVLGRMKLSDLHRADLAKLLEVVHKRNGIGMANQVRKYLTTALNRAVEHEIIEFSPMAGLKKVAKTKPRERYLKDEEIRHFWCALDSGKLEMSGEIKRILKLILVTGQRPGDVAGLQHKELRGNTWTIPASRYKTEIDQEVRLTGLAVKLLTESKARAGYLFPTPHKSKHKPIPANSVAKAVRRNHDAIGLDHFTPHDLRRTCASGLAMLGYSDEVIDAVLGHTKKGIVATYNHHKYEAEKAAALMAWEQHLTKLLGLAKPKKRLPTEMPEWEPDPNDPEWNWLLK